jgi:putative Holliday junction resolvase
MGRILAIDYGTKRVGLAVTDPMQLFATALTTVASHELMTYLKAYCTKETVDCFVLGEPKTLKNEPSESAQKINEFAVYLQRSFPHTPISRVDERFTSSIASQTIAQSGMSKQKRQEKGRIDQISAVLILQTYLAQIQA